MGGNAGGLSSVPGANGCHPWRLSAAGFMHNEQRMPVFAEQDVKQFTLCIDKHL